MVVGSAGDRILFGSEHFAVLKHSRHESHREALILGPTAGTQPWFPPAHGKFGIFDPVVEGETPIERLHSAFLAHFLTWLMQEREVKGTGTPPFQ